MNSRYYNLYRRIVATNVSAQWKYNGGEKYKDLDYDGAYDRIVSSLKDMFFGPAKGGVFSPSVQFTLYQMGQEAIKRRDSLYFLQICF